MARRRGRRPGTAHTREAILIAARETFANKGYDRAPIRAIAAGAAVDQALVYHCFGSKEKLFLAVMNIPIDLDVMTQAILNAPRAEVGIRLVRLILDICDSPAGTATRALLLSQHEQRADRLPHARVHRHPDPSSRDRGARGRPRTGAGAHRAWSSPKSWAWW